MLTHRLLPSTGLLLGFALLAGALTSAAPRAAAPPEPPDRSPVDLALTRDEQWLLTANHTTGSVSLVHLPAGRLATELPVGRQPAAVALTPDDRLAVVSCARGEELVLLSLQGPTLRVQARLPLSGSPHGIAIAPDGRTAYVALADRGAVAVIDLPGRRVTAHIAVGRWPRFLALSPDGKRLAVGVSGDGGVAVVDPIAGKRLFVEEFVGMNLGQMQVSRDGRFVTFPWIISGNNPTTPLNIQRGWALASRIARVRLDRPARREAIALDPRGRAVGDPHGLALSPDETRLVCTAGGTHELLVFRTAGLPFQDYGGPGDHIDDALLRDQDRFRRIDLGGRPMTVRFRRDGRRVLVANYLGNSVQEVDLDAGRVVREVRLGGPAVPSLARRGEAIFHDATRSLDQWYSCHSCHFEGGGNAPSMDTGNDGRYGTFKTVPDLRGVARTGPWFWHGNVPDLDAALRRSFTGTLAGKEPSTADLHAVRAYLASLEVPPGPFRQPVEAIRRGETVFRGPVAGCSRCHPTPTFSDGKVHDVGTGRANDAYRGFNPPSLRGVHRRVTLLHDGRSPGLEELLRGPHAPERVTGRGSLSARELADLLAYLRSL